MGIRRGPLRERNSTVNPYWKNDAITLYCGDCREVLRELPENSVHCVITSPPYWGLRDYGVDGQLGLEPTAELYVQHLVEVFREVRRVLRDDGTLWLNLGSSYAGSNKGMSRNGPSHGPKQRTNRGSMGLPVFSVPTGFKPKDLVPIPWMVAMALQADGWWLRSDIIWQKVNCMPESVRDRPTTSHEYIFLLAKSRKYYYDQDAIREPHKPEALGRYEYEFWPEGTKEAEGAGRPDGAPNTGGMKSPHPLGRNKRTVWAIPTRPYHGAHYAVFPPDLVEPMILAGTSAKGCCPKCGAPWERIVTKGEPIQQHWAPGTQKKINKVWGKYGESSIMETGFIRPNITIGWRPTCRCSGLTLIKDPPRPPYTDDPYEETVHTLRMNKWLEHWEGFVGDGLRSLYEAEPKAPCVVLDPFAGSGTVGEVAIKHNRRAILIELSETYCRENIIPRLEKPIQRILIPS